MELDFSREALFTIAFEATNRGGLKMKLHPIPTCNASPLDPRLSHQRKPFLIRASL
jgi:hypothetical protein